MNDEEFGFLKLLILKYRRVDFAELVPTQASA